MATFNLNSSTIGVDLNTFNATALFAVGTHVLGSNNTEWVYVQANTSIVGQRMVAFNAAYTCGMASGADILSGQQLGLAQTSCSSQAFFWVAIRGNGLTVATTGSCTATAQGIFLAASATPTGVLSNVASASGTLAGVSFTDVGNQTATATFTTVSLSWPRGAAAGM